MDAESKRCKQKKLFFLTVKDFLIAYKEVLFQYILAIAIILIGTYRISESTMPILLDDEYGYWSNSAFFTGDNWSSITSNIAYYSYGYSFLLAPIRLFAKRYDLTWAAVYQFAHLTFTECTLIGIFWIFLYLMMKVIDRPNVANHIGYAVAAFYIYTVHQRAFAVLITSVIVMLYLRIIKKNTLKHTAAYGIVLFLCSLFHSVIKGILQNVSYRGNEPGGWKDIVRYIFTKKSMFILAVGLVNGAGQFGNISCGSMVLSVCDG